jgi:hypothetical protein
MNIRAVSSRICSVIHVLMKRAAVAAVARRIETAVYN